jgi:hypothetical protein
MTLPKVIEHDRRRSKRNFDCILEFFIGEICKVVLCSEMIMIV